MIVGPCWNRSVFPEFHLLRQNAHWHLNFDTKSVGLFILRRFVGIIFYSQASCTQKWTPSSHSFCTSNSPWARQQGVLESLRLQEQRPIVCFQKRHTKSSVHDNTGLQKWKGKSVFLERARKASHGDLQELDVHLARASAGRVCQQAAVKQWCVLAVNHQDYILTNNP